MDLSKTVRKKRAGALTRPLPSRVLLLALELGFILVCPVATRGAPTGWPIQDSTEAWVAPTFRTRAPSPTPIPHGEPSLTPPQVKFDATALGTSSSSALFTLTNNSAVTINLSTVKVDNPDFTENTGCGGPLPPTASCEIAITFKPTVAQARSGTLTVSVFEKGSLSAALSGLGTRPEIKGVILRPQPAFATVNLGAFGFAPLAPVLVDYKTVVPGQNGASFSVPAVKNSGSTITLVVPPVFSSDGELVAGTATLGRVRELLSSNVLDARLPSAPRLHVTPPSASSTMSPEEAVLAFLQGESDFAAQLETDVVNTPLEGLKGSLGQLMIAIDSLITTVGGGAGPTIGTVAGANVTVGAASLTASESQLLDVLNELANQNAVGSSSARRIGPIPQSETVGSGCLAAEAAQALSDHSDPAAFATDIKQLFMAAESSTACQQPDAAVASAGIVEGAAGVTLGTLEMLNLALEGAGGGTGGGGGGPVLGRVQARPPSNAGAMVDVKSRLSAEALTYAIVGPASQVIDLGLSLAQTSDQARRSVENTLKTFNLGEAPHLGEVVSQTTGELKDLYARTKKIADSLDLAVQLFDGRYSGTFSGTQVLKAASSDPLSGSLDLSVAGSTIAVNTPAPGSGKLTNENARFKALAVAGSNVSCSFNGTFAVDLEAAASASGTWSCSPTDRNSSLVAANGTWSATRQ